MSARGSAITAVLLTLAACSAGSAPPASGTAQASASCTGSCANASTFLSVQDVSTVIAQAVAEAQALHARATIAVVDRVGNVLAVYRMGASGAPAEQVVIASALDSSGHSTINAGLEGIRLPVPVTGLSTLSLDDQAAIAKAVTGAYLSTEGNAFSTRTASQIIQEHFLPNQAQQPSGPLFGVQFSQLACSDLITSYNGTTPDAGPHSSPLGLSADPGGFPLYMSGTVVGGVGVIADGIYGIDNALNTNAGNIDEDIAWAATYGFAAPADRRADQITVDGRTLLFSSVDFPNLKTNPADAPPLNTLGAATGSLIAVPGYTDGTIQPGTAFEQPASGIRADAGVDFPGEGAYVLVNDSNVPRYPPIAAKDGLANGLSQAEVLQLLRSALAVANEARAQIRQPLGSTARVTISVVDTQGNVLGVVRSGDAAIFGIDVSLQKARTAAFTSSSTAATYVNGLPPATYITTDDSGLHLQTVQLASYVTATQSFVPDPGAFGQGAIAYSVRALGGLSRPLYPDGIDGSPPGPLSKPPGSWSVFSTGFELDLSINAILQHVLFVSGFPLPDVGPGCTGVALDLTSRPPSAMRITADIRLGDGLQIFPGGVPIYRGATLVGGIGVSGDGVDQDDMVAFLGLANASSALNGSIGNAPASIRADTLLPQGVRLKYVQCPQSPFVNSDAEDVCAGL